MGLDVSFYKDLKFIKSENENKYNDECNYEYNYIEIWNLDTFKKYYEPLKAGYYEGTLIADFNAGSYISYGIWREQLCEKVLKVKPIATWKNPKHYESMPFFYLICFVDNQGVIAGDAFKKLQSDFKKYDITFDEEYYTKKYQLWKEAILKSECIIFH